jgi:hypothetical protein
MNIGTNTMQMANDKGALPTAKEQQDHERGECRGDHCLAHHSRDRGAHEQRLVPHQIDVEPRRQLVTQGGQPLLDVPDDIERRGPAGLEHAH